jgi:hypothetical protein
VALVAVAASEDTVGLAFEAGRASEIEGTASTTADVIVAATSSFEKCD